MARTQGSDFASCVCNVLTSCDVKLGSMQSMFASQVETRLEAVVFKFLDGFRSPIQYDNSFATSRLALVLFIYFSLVGCSLVLLYREASVGRNTSTDTQILKEGQGG